MIITFASALLWLNLYARKHTDGAQRLYSRVSRLHIQHPSARFGTVRLISVILPTLSDSVAIF